MFPLCHSPLARRKQKELEKYFPYCTLHHAITITYCGSLSPSQFATSAIPIPPNSDPKVVDTRYMDDETSNGRGNAGYRFIQSRQHNIQLGLRPCQILLVSTE